ncbi:transposase [Nocardia sp. NPDC059246]|uniref:transposase n=1 Tax=unclassified Nocardia TaxID=2637762 RepID=UPI00367BA57E
MAEVGIEGIGSYGAELARHLHARGHDIAEVPRPNRRLRRTQGKTDTIDAYAAARRLLDGSGVTAPKLRNGAIEAVRALHVARHNAVKATTASMNTLRGLITCEGGGHLRRVSSRSCPFRRSGAGDQPGAAFARCWVREAQDQASQLERHLHTLLEQVAPHTLNMFALGPDTAAALVISIGDNPDRLISEAAFARLRSVAPIPACSGKTVRHRLHRGGDRQANQALHVAVIVRLRYDQRTRAYVARRTAEGKTKPEIIRCLIGRVLISRSDDRIVVLGQHSDHGRLGGPSVPEAGAGTDLRGGLCATRRCFTGRGVRPCGVSCRSRGPEAGDSRAT